jgi:HEPN domain-containing protein
LDWFRIGDKELLRARNLLNLEDAEGACFNIQQAVEKYLKGYLISQGWKLRRIHDLETLLNEALTYDVSFESFRPACQKITQYYVEDRYPFTATSELTEKEAQESFTIAEALIKKIQTLIK